MLISKIELGIPFAIKPFYSRLCISFYKEMIMYDFIDAFAREIERLARLCERPCGWKFIYLHDVYFVFNT